MGLMSMVLYDLETKNAHMTDLARKYIKGYACTLFVLFVMCLTTLQAKIEVEGPDKFMLEVNATLDEAQTVSKYLKKLIQKIKQSKRCVIIRPITNDKSTWHRSKKKSRSHTEVLHSSRSSTNENIPVDAVIYLNPNRISKENKTYKKGILIHELVHALDLVSGHYNSDYIIREKRAVFFQNIWRDMNLIKLRSDYHGRFKTQEYEYMKKKGKVDMMVNYCLSHDDIP